MKKYFKYISALALVAMAAMSMTSCSEDKLGETIFPDVTDELDPSSYTYKFDKWLKENYLDVYNLDFQYRLKDTETNMNYNLEPATLSNAVDIAVLAKYMWFDIYEEVTGSKEFVKTYGPRILMLVGSPAINPQTGTIIVGLAEGGIKVTLLHVNSMEPMDIYGLNNDYFHTMHHEFSHILHQTKTIPREFQLLSLGRYDAVNWQDRNEGVVHSLGFVTPYGSSEIREDFAETIANYITLTDGQWSRLWEEAARGYATDGDEENGDMSELNYYCFQFYDNNEAIPENLHYAYEYKVDRYKYTNYDDVDDDEFIYYFACEDPEMATGYRVKYLDREQKDAEGNLLIKDLKDSEGNFVMAYPVEDKDGVDGVALLEQKINICRNWFMEQWNIDLDQLRNVVQNRLQNFNATTLDNLRQQVYGAQ